MTLHKLQSFIPSDSAVNQTLAPLLQYLNDPNVFEVRVNKFGQVVTARSNGRDLHDEPAITPAYINNLTNTLLSYNGLGPSPIMDVKLPNGSRGVIVRPPAVLEGTVLICIRQHLQVSKSISELDKEGRFKNAKRRTMVDMLKLDPVEEMLLDLLDKHDVEEFFRQAVLHRRNICVAGKTGSGKSTLTRSLLAEVAPTERILMMEDVHEVEADNQYEVGYMMYGAQEGRISAKQCLKAAMRLSPDRIFLTDAARRCRMGLPDRREHGASGGHLLDARGQRRDDVLTHRRSGQRLGSGPHDGLQRDPESRPGNGGRCNPHGRPRSNGDLL